MTTLVAELQAQLLARGYRFETIESAEGVEERMYRPDGSVAVIALKLKVEGRRPGGDSAPAPVREPVRTEEE